MAVEARAVLHVEAPGQGKKPVAFVFRHIPDPGNDGDQVQIGVLGANDQQLTCNVNSLDFINALKVIFPELSIS